MHLMKYRKNYFFITVFVMAICIVLLMLVPPKLSIDFTGGSVFTYQLPAEVFPSDAQRILEEAFAFAQTPIESITYESGLVIVRTKPVESDIKDKVDTFLEENGSTLGNNSSFEYVGSVVGIETFKKAGMALLISFLAILLYIAYSFSNIPKPYSSVKFGASALFAMVHDVLIVLAVFGILGSMFDIAVDVMFVTALLTIIGFSVNDTIVVFDRIRENLLKHKKKTDFVEIVNTSILETLRRSLATATTVLLILISLFVFGGSSIRYFVLAIIIGIITGAYSSVFVASPLLLLWENKKK